MPDSCCPESDAPGCFADPECEEIVCSEDEWCCDQAWDSMLTTAGH